MGDGTTKKGRKMIKNKEEKKESKREGIGGIKERNKRGIQKEAQAERK